ncbi:MAG: HNH endonuclease [Bdellovibrionaceae bacterium]|nr:HNH endonuclease [Pseudobdellovibrionaceae bacterium]MBX3032307.1 HNH endonuclease [Pseudobdellovibrionaceae bacterium]
MNPAQLKDQDLLSTLRELAHDERNSCLRLIQHLREMDARKLYLRIGYPSLFEYVMKELRLSAGAAYRRIQAMRLITDVPELEEKVASGELQLVSAAQLQGFFQSEKKRNRSYSLDDKLELVEQLKGCSVPEAEKELVKINPQFQRQERPRPLPDSRYELTLLLTEELRYQLDELRHLLSHRNPNMNYVQLVEFLADLALKKYSPNRQRHRPRPIAPPGAEMKFMSRMIPAALRTEVWLRDGGSCSYTHPETGRRCGSKHLLQVDHIHPLRLGGKTESKNLRLLCSAHNLWRSELTFQPTTHAH